METLKCEMWVSLIELSVVFLKSVFLVPHFLEFEVLWLCKNLCNFGLIVVPEVAGLLDMGAKKVIEMTKYNFFRCHLDVI